MVGISPLLPFKKQIFGEEEKVAAALVKNFEFLQKIDLVNAGLLSADEIKKNKAPVIVMSSYITTLLDHIY